jgi:hypothetical protein
VRHRGMACAQAVLHEGSVDAGSGAVLDETEKVANGSDRRDKPQGGGQMTPTERERVKAALRAYRDQHHLSVHDLAARINAEGKRVDPKTLHRYLDRRLIVDDSVVEVYRTFVDRPG